MMVPGFCNWLYASVVELVYTSDLKSDGRLGYAGSSPATRTIHPAAIFLPLSSAFLPLDFQRHNHLR